MKRKIIIASSILLVLILGIYYIFINKKVEVVTEILPEEEISEEQFRETIVSLYFVDKETNELTPEARLIDVKELMNNPYITLVNLLIDGPKSDKLISYIPEGTKINSAKLENSVLIIDLSEEFINEGLEDETLESKTIYSIVNTLTELVEVDSVKILINGTENMSFTNSTINFSEPFVRIN